MLASAVSSTDAQHQQAGKQRRLRRPQSPARTTRSASLRRWRPAATAAGRSRCWSSSCREGAGDRRWRRPAANRCRSASCSGAHGRSGCPPRSPRSTIWREDWAKRLSSRSSGGRLRMPGSHSSSPSSASRAKGRRASRVSQRGGAGAGSGAGRDRGGFLSFSGACESVMPGNYVGPAPMLQSAGRV